MEIKQPTLETELLFKPFNMGAVMVITAITRVIFEERAWSSITGKRLDYIGNKSSTPYFSQVMTIGLLRPPKKGSPLLG